MASQQLCLRVIGLAALLTLTTLGGKSPFNLFPLSLIYVVAEAEHAPSKSSVAIPSSKAQEFLAKLSRTKRNVWDRSRPDVQQWIMQFMQMGFDEQRLEADLQHWMDHARSHDQGRQHHYDENAPIGPRSSYRHGANVNYDYY
uniref:ECRG4 augurin precursor a n=1 Tax=Xiphophorus couchianus TaxID=32473 RepID=A0A3B5MVA0_9TELE